MSHLLIRICSPKHHHKLSDSPLLQLLYILLQTWKVKKEIVKINISWFFALITRKIALRGWRIFYDFVEKLGSIWFLEKSSKVLHKSKCHLLMNFLFNTAFCANHLHFRHTSLKTFEIWKPPVKEILFLKVLINFAFHVSLFNSMRKTVFFSPPNHKNIKGIVLLIFVSKFSES